MHRSIEASFPSAHTDNIVAELSRHPEVVGLTLARYASVIPAGDSLTVHVLNKGVDDVLRILSKHVGMAPLSVVTSEVASISDRAHQKEINRDVDEAIWEELETGLRHNGRLTPNYMFLMILGGIIAAVGFVSEIETQIIAIVAASIIAPGLEPLLKLPLGLALRNTGVLKTGVLATIIGYALLILAAGATLGFVLWTGEAPASTFLNNNFLQSLQQLTHRDVIFSTAAAMAGVIMYLSYRRNVIAGPLIAIFIVPAAAAFGMCAILGEWKGMLLLLRRMAMDVSLIILTGIILIRLKQKFVHKRAPLR